METRHCSRHCGAQRQTGLYYVIFHIVIFVVLLAVVVCLQMFLTRQPAKAYFILQRLCHKLRKTTQDYLNVCRTVYEAAEDEKNDRKQSAALERGIADICAAYREPA